MIAASPQAGRAATLKKAKTRADRRVGISQEPADTPPPPLPLPRVQRPLCRQVNTIEEDEGERETGKEES